VDRQWSNKRECHAAQARRVVMADGLGSAHRRELKDKQLLSLHTELRSYRLNASGMNKIARSASATPWSIKRRTCMPKLAIVATALLAVFGGGQPVFAQAAISEPGAYAFYHPDADVLNAGRPTSADSANASANERDTRIDDPARTPQTLSRHHRHSSAASSRMGVAFA
jgi:hypothetical protein